MADDQGPGPDQGALAFQRGLGSSGGGGSTGGGAAKDVTNTGEMANDLSRGVHNATIVVSSALTAGVPLPINAGSALNNGGAQQGLESDGWASKMITSIMEKTNFSGGFLPNLLHGVFIKNFHDVKPQTDGVGGGEQIAAASQGDGPRIEGIEIAALPIGDAKLPYTEVAPTYDFHPLPTGGGKAAEIQLS